MSTPQRYKAFISYSRRDAGIAKWLHRSLERYRPPARLGIAKSDTQLKPIFLDQEELRASADLGDSIYQALQHSDFLIVVCSEHAAQSKWVNQEVLAFKQLKGDAQVLALVISGDPGLTSGPAQCFPAALRHQIAANGTITDVLAEPLAADLRPAGDGKRLALLKLVATMLDVQLSQLVQREAQRRLRVVTAASGLALVITVAMSILAYTAVQQRDRAEIAQAYAEERRDASEGLIEFMLGELRDRLVPVGRLDVLDVVGKEALDFYKEQDIALLDQESLGRQARAMHLLGEISELRGETETALTIFRSAKSSTGELLARNPDDQQRIFDHAQSVFWVGYIAWQRNQFAIASESFGEYQKLAKRLVELDSNNPDWQLELHYSYINAGALAFETGEWIGARDNFTQALKIAEELVVSAPDESSWQAEVADSVSWLASTYLSLLDFDRAAAHNEREIAIYRELLAEQADNRFYQDKLIIAYSRGAELLSNTGNTVQAFERLQAALELATELVALEPENTTTLEAYGKIRLHQAILYFHTGAIEESWQALNQYDQLASSLAAIDSGNLRWDVELYQPSNLLRARLLFAERNYQKASSVLEPSSKSLAAIKQEEFSSTTLSSTLGALLLLQGDVQSALGDDARARALWQAAAQQLDGVYDQMEPLHISRLATALARTGKQQQAVELIEQLTSAGYRHPEFVLAAADIVVYANP